MKQKQWEEAVAEALGWVRYRGLLSVGPSDFHPVRRDDGLSVAAGVARDWYGLPNVCGAWQMTDDEWTNLGRPSELDPEWLRAGAGEWLGYVLGDAPEDFVRLSHLRPDLVALVPQSVWLRKDDHGEPLVSQHLRWGGVARVVPESVWPEYVSWVAGRRGSISDKADSLANLSHGRPDLVAQVPESVWLRKDADEEPLVSKYLCEGGVAGVVPEPVFSRYSSWVAGELGELLQKAESLAKLSHERPDLVALVPESVWMLEDRYGEPLVSQYLRWEGVAGGVPEPVLAGYVSWVVGRRGPISYKATSLAKLSHGRPDLVAQVPKSAWLRKDRYGEPLVSRYLRAGGAATAVPEIERRIQ